MLNITNSALEKLRELQPDLVCSPNQISGCFHLSATRDSSSIGSKKEFNVFPYNFTSNRDDPNFIYEKFCISATFKYKGEYLDLIVRETGGKFDSWREDILPEYWHFNLGNSFCLGIDSELKEIQDGSENFGIYFDNVISQFLYYMTYTQRNGVEPWKGDRHGLFKAFEIAQKHDRITPELREQIRLCLVYDFKYWERLLRVVSRHIINKELKIKKSFDCPFCFLNKKIVNRPAGKCDTHKEEIGGFNRVSNKLFCNNINIARHAIMRRREILALRRYRSIISK